MLNQHFKGAPYTLPNCFAETLHQSIFPQAQWKYALFLVLLPALMPVIFTYLVNEKSCLM